jgi:hypothetical protein
MDEFSLLARSGIRRDSDLCEVTPTKGAASFDHLVGTGKQR